MDGRGSGPASCTRTKDYDYARCRNYLRKRDITARIARKGIESRDCLGRYRWIVDRSHAWFAGSGSCASVLSEDSTFTRLYFRWPLPSSANTL
jgi:hypothetical protein